jgi:hypothetical protein
MFLGVGFASTDSVMKAPDESDTAAHQSLLATDADGNAKDESGMTVLMLAAALVQRTAITSARRNRFKIAPRALFAL